MSGVLGVRCWGLVRVRLVLGLFLIMLGTATGALANGGTVQVSNHVSGPYQLSVFTSPSPIRVGTVDVSVLVQRAGANDVVEDAVAMVMVEGLGPGGGQRTFEATHEQATNKLYYAANVDLPYEGRWKMDVLVVGSEGEGTAGFEVEATRETLMERPGVLAAMLALPVLLLLGWMVLSGRGRQTGERTGGGQE